jgi:hypothetical protein
MFSKNKNLVIGYEEQGLQKKDRLTWMKQRRTTFMTLKHKRQRNMWIEQKIPRCTHRVASWTYHIL